VLPGPKGILALWRDGQVRPWQGARAALRVTDANAEHSWDVAIYTSFPARFGRARDEQVHIPVRLYPLEAHKEASMRVSSVHGEFDRSGAWWTVRDLASRNGIILNGKAITQDVPKELTQTAEVALSSAITLECHALTQVDANVVTIDGEGLRPARSPALAVFRVGNRPELVYVLLAQCLRIGGDDPRTAMVAPGMQAPRAGSLWWYEGAFYWQPHRSDTLEALGPGSSWEAAGLHFCIGEFTYDLFR
jgi:hypothetical protein